MNSVDKPDPSSDRRVLLSVVLPVYNEAATIATVLDAILAYEHPVLELELLIIESNSTDGTREIVRDYESNPRVRVLFQDAPRGKGNAVRAGLASVRGDIVLIQDGDLEYEVSDYTVLLDPIVAGRADFVLGNRHVRGRPIRDFPESRVLSRLMNVAHWVLLGLFNLTYGTRLRDPFTMFKVFRASCIEGLDFVSDRFDFDWELMAKLVRSGYEPLEVPVTYHSRGYDKGKKVRFFRDPPTWIAACIRFRFARLDRHPTGVDTGVAPERAS